MTVRGQRVKMVPSTGNLNSDESAINIALSDLEAKHDLFICDKLTPILSLCCNSNSNFDLAGYMIFYHFADKVKTY